ncbi:MAG: GTP 3',8-cyclase MoaA [Candidatus Limnocylindria bacterium]
MDALRRPLRDLRISVTDRCNFRCVYCMPREVYGPDHAFLATPELLTFDEIARLARVFVELGVDKLRLTGGEPLVRKGIERLIADLHAIDGVRELTLTTNGSLLASSAERLRKAGLDRVTISLDALDDATATALNGVGARVGPVLAGIEAAAAAGLGPIKINTVVKRGVNDHSVVELARHFRWTGHVVRFIEYMDVGHTNGWRPDDVVSGAEMVRSIDALFQLEPIEPGYRSEVARRYRYVDGAGEIGVIASVSEPFCRDCTRARLSADGRLYTCLFAMDGHDLRTPLRAGVDDRELGDAIGRIWARRDDRYSELRTLETVALSKVEMSYIGG